MVVHDRQVPQARRADGRRGGRRDGRARDFL